MKIGCSSWSFRKLISNGEYDLRDFIKKLPEIGVVGAELLESNIEEASTYYVNSLINLGKSVGVEIYSLALENDFACTEEDKRQIQIRRVKNWIRIAGMTEIPYLRVFTGDIKPRTDYDILGRYVKDSYEQCIKEAEKQGVYLAIENHSEVYRSTAELRSLLESINSKYLKICLDPYNFKSINNQEEDIYQGAKDLISLAVYTHAKFDDFKEGIFQLNYNCLLKVYTEANFNGYLSIEFAGSDDPIKSVKTSAGILKKAIDGKEKYFE